MPKRIVEPIGTSEEAYEQLDEWLTDILGASNADLNEEVLAMLDGYYRLLRISLGLPVDAGN